LEALKNYNDFSIDIPLPAKYRSYEKYVKNFIARVATYTKKSSREIFEELTKTE
jgi:hypothetical protein